MDGSRVGSTHCSGRVGVIAGLVGGLAHDFNRKDLTMAFVAVGAVGGGLCAWVVFIAARHYLTGLFTKISPGGQLLGLPLVFIPIVLVAIGIIAATALISV